MLTPWSYSSDYNIVLCISPPFTVNPRHVWPVSFKFEWSFKINMSALNISNKISEFP